MKRASRKTADANRIDPRRAQHLDLAVRRIVQDGEVADVLMDDSESPLAWLARRKSPDGRPMISPEQFIAGEKLRADFTRAQMTPRVTSNWGAPTGRAAPGRGAGEMTDVVLAANQRVRHAMEACGPEFAGFLMDVCCFLRGLEDAERERGWPRRSGKVILQLGLDRLARHYGLARDTHGGTSAIRAWADSAS